MARKRRSRGSIVRLADGSFKASVELPRGLDGKRRRRERKRRTEEEAREALKALLEELDGPSLASNDRTGDFLRYWLEQQTGLVAWNTQQNYRRAVERILPVLGNVRLSDLKRRHCREFVSHLMAHGYKASSIHQMHRVLVTALNFAEDEDLIQKNPARRLKLPPVEKRTPATLTAEQGLHLLESTRGDRMRVTWALGLLAALRVGEATGLTWERAHQKKALLDVSEQIIRIDGKWYFIPSKTKSSRVTLPASKLLLDIIEEHRIIQVEDKLAAGPAWKETGLVVRRKSGAPIGRKGVSKALREALDQAGLPRIRFHDLRHSAATLLFQLGEHPKTVQAVMRHATIKQTMDTYTHAGEEVRENALQKLGRLVEGT